MQVIDRDNLTNKAEILYQHTESGKIIPWSAVRVCAINNIKTIEAEVVRHGQWVPVDGEAPCDEWVCTACGRRMTFMVDMDEDDMAENYWRCPKCGAKMDGGKQ